MPGKYLFPYKYKSAVVSKMHSNEVILFFLKFKQVKHDYSLPRAYAVICGRLDITVNTPKMFIYNDSHLSLNPL